MDILPRRGKRAFSRFIKALNETQQKHLTTLLCSNEGALECTDLDFTDLACDYWKKALDVMKNEIECPDTHLMKMKVLPMTEDFRSKLRLQSDVYRLDPERKKLAVIINNKYFSKSPEREGSQNDIENFSYLLEQLDFTLIRRQDLDVVGIKQQLEDARMKLQSGLYDVFVCCIMSHGAKGVVYGIDQNELNISNDILTGFSDQNCPEMVGKPKLFFIQACQTENGTDACPAVSDTGKAVWSNSDLFLAVATAEGYKAWRHPELGSCFIRTIVYVFSYRACKDHINDLLAQVCNILSRFLANENFSQVAERKDTLSKKLYLMS